MPVSKKPEKNGKKGAGAKAAAGKALSPAAQRKLVKLVAEEARSNPVFEIRGIPVTLSTEHHDVLVAGLAASARVTPRAPAIPAALMAEQLARLADELAAREARSTRGFDRLPPLPQSVRERQ
jgi:hypothetical protein